MKKIASQGPLDGIRILEMPAIGPVPFCGMLLADLGADVLCIDRIPDPAAKAPVPAHQVHRRGKRSLPLNLKQPGSAALALALAGRADVLLEGFRPGVMERLGLGPDICLAANSGLIYGRMTGWGQDGPLAASAGHDINYIAVAGALHAIGEAGRKPVPPLNLLGDYSGGALYLAMGVLAALHERSRSGQGQVIDAAMVDGTASLMSLFSGLAKAGRWSEVRGTNRLDGGAPWYDTYECADGTYISLGAIESGFYDALVERLGLDASALPAQNDRAGWQILRSAIAAAIKSRSRDDWCRHFEGSDACFAPVLSLSESARHPHLQARGTFVDIDGVVQPAPAPRFSRTPGQIRSAPPAAGEGAQEALRDWGIDPAAFS